MGYTTYFEGKIEVSPPFDTETIEEINKFAEEDHRNDLSLPGSYCDWITDGDSLYWDGMEKFYDSEEWMKYLIDTWVIPTGRTSNGLIECEGEDNADIWRIAVKDNVVSRVNAVISWPTEVTIEWPDKTERWEIDEVTLVEPYTGRHRF